MAASTAFKQQCPSCEAMVPIKDPKQIGKKTDCPTCKYRFVVEAPAGEKDEETKEENGVKKAPAKPGAAPAKKPAGKPAAAVKGKAKPGIKRRTDLDDDEDEEEHKPKRGGKPNVVLIGVGVGVLALGLLGVATFFMMQPSGDPNSQTRKIIVRKDKDANKDKGDPVPAGPIQVDVRNLLPNDTDAVTFLNVPAFLDSGLGQAAFHTIGAFRLDGFKDKLGLPLEDMFQFVRAENSKGTWSFMVLRSKADKEIKKDQLKGLAKSPKTPGGAEFYLMEPNEVVELLAALVKGDMDEAKPKPANPAPLAAHFLDKNTVIFTDPDLMEKFLLAGAKFNVLAKPPADANAPKPPPTYETINPALKAVLDKIDDGKQHVVCYRLQDIHSALKGSYVLDPAGQAGQLLAAQGIQKMATAMQAVNPTHFTLTIGLDCDSDAIAKKLEDTAQKQLLPALAGLIQYRLGVKLDPAGKPIPDPAANPLPAGEAAPTGITLFRAQKTLWFTVDLALEDKVYHAVMYRYLQQQVRLLKGMADMAHAVPRLHDLAAAGHAYAQKNGKFPRGTFARPIGAERLGRPWPPDQRVSWMVHLLPYLDPRHQHARTELMHSIKGDMSWRDIENLDAGLTLIPEFLNLSFPRSTWWVRPPSMPYQELAATHFVGIAGVGLDAAEYPRLEIAKKTDQEIAKKIGIFGYDRETAVSEITDGLPNTIMMIQVPPTLKRPWIAGGGSTIQGVMETKSVQPFVSTQADGKRGTYALMADGSVRFIPEGIPDETFKAMCTIAGGEKIADLDKVAPLVPGPGKAILKTQPPGNPNP